MWNSMMGHYCTYHITNLKNALALYHEWFFFSTKPRRKKEISVSKKQKQIGIFHAMSFKPLSTFNLGEVNIMTPILKILKLNVREDR